MLEFKLFDEIDEENTKAAIKFLGENNKQDVILNIDSIGGDVFAGLRLCQAIQNHKGKVTAKCGICVASIASIIALSCDNLLVTKDSFFMIHKAWSCVMGTADEMRTTADLLDQASSRLIEIVEDKAVNKEAVADWFVGETWMGYKEILDNFNDVKLSTYSAKMTDGKRESYAKLENKPEALMNLIRKKKVDAETQAYIDDVLKRANDILENN